jgi:polyvinyl alcohol dehydrogenase (cytochrome)
VIDRLSFVLALSLTSGVIALSTGCGAGSDGAGTDVSPPLADVGAEVDASPGAGHYQSACAVCHDGGVQRAPHRGMLSLMTPESILTSLEVGIMREQAAALTAEARVEVAEFLSGNRLGERNEAPIPRCTAEVGLDLDRPPVTRNWGMQVTNTRSVPAEVAALNPADVTALKPRWALKFPGANRTRSQPVLMGSLLLTGSHGGMVYALDSRSGCEVWSFQASAEVRTGIAAQPWPPGDEQAQPLVYFGDVLGNVYAVEARTGALRWRQRADDHPNATITGSPSLHAGMLYVPVSALEVSLAVDPYYECCTFRGSVVAYDAATGEQRWKTYTIDEPAVVQSQNSVGTNMRGPSGAVIWNSPAIDVRRNQLTVGTGENMSSPATLTSDAIIAMDLTTGAINWSFQATPNDVWNVACDSPTPQSCPPEGGPDFDFGAATLLVSLSNGQELVIGGQKSGLVHALDPDTGELIWQTRVGRGGIQGGIHFGMAAEGDRLYVPISDMLDGRTYDDPRRPGLHALDLKTGTPLWYSPSPDVCGEREFCDPGISQAVTAAAGMVFAGGMDGVLRIHDGESGEVLLSLDTTSEYPTVTGETTRGGSFGGGAGPVVQDGLVILSSGYGIYNHMAGNLLLVLER